MTGWQSVLAVILLDYIVAFAVIGFAGIFRRVVKSQATALTMGCVLACVLRYASHVIVGRDSLEGSFHPDAGVARLFLYL